MSNKHNILNPPIGTFPVKVELNEKRNKWGKKPKVSKGTNPLTYQATQKELDNASNIGVTIPQNILVIDLDISEGVTLEDLQASIEIEFDAEFEVDWNEAFLQRTISGGAHYAFTIPSDIEIIQQTNCRDIPGFDLRVAGKGWICSGKDYSTENSKHDDVISALYSGELPSLPSIITDSLGQNKVSNDDSDDDFMSMVVNQPKGLSDASIIDYMSRLPESYADDQDDWRNVGMALYHETEGSEFGWELFDEFSNQCPENYDERANRSRWDSFGGGSAKKLTFASIIKWVKDSETSEKIETSESTVEELLKKLDTVTGGYRDLKAYCSEVGKSGLDKVDINRIVSSIKSRDKELVDEKLSLADIKLMMKRPKESVVNAGDYIDDYVFMKSTAEYMHRDTKATMGPRAFDVTHTRDTPLDMDDNQQSATFFTQDKIECVETAMYVPMFANIFIHEGLSYINSYTPLNLVPKKDTGNIVERIKGHIAHLLPNKDEQQIVINYLAHNVQRPGEKLHWGIVLQGVQGDGKSLLAKLMQLVMGLRNVRTMNVQTLESNFTGWAVGQCMIFIEELKLDNFRKYEILNNLKPYISNDIIEVTAKGKDPRVVMNTTNYFALTNFKDALPLDDKDRRYCILFSQWQSSKKLAEFEANNFGYYADLYSDMDTSAEELLGWLLNHDIPQSFLDTKRAPTTTAKQAMSMLAKSEGYSLVEDAIAEFQGPLICDEVINLTALIKHVSSLFAEDYKDFPKTNALKNILTDMGYHNIGRVKNNDKRRKNQTIYCKDDTKVAKDFTVLVNSSSLYNDEF